MTVYLDCNATAPLEPEVAAQVVRWFTEEIGNAGSRTHHFGQRAKEAVQQSRQQVASVVDAQPEEVVFTSGATESNNIAILGLSPLADQEGKRHIISTAIEHKAVLEPLEVLARRGFEITLLRPTAGGYIDPDDVRRALRSDTAIVSVMHVNNETGVEQPLHEIGLLLSSHDAYFHVDAAQGFGKRIAALRNPRIDLISVSSHKIYGPVGVGALIARKRGYRRPPLSPLVFGGGQERGIRPGTLPVPLIVGLGLASEIALRDAEKRAARCAEIRQEALAALEGLDIQLNGDPERSLPHVLNFSVTGIDSEAVMVALKDLAAVSNGSACTSQSYQPSHVLTAMGLSSERVNSALRVSWCHLTPQVRWEEMAQRLTGLL